MWQAHERALRGAAPGGCRLLRQEEHDKAQRLQLVPPHRPAGHREGE